MYLRIHRIITRYSMVVTMVSAYLPCTSHSLSHLSLVRRSSSTIHFAEEETDLAQLAEGFTLLLWIPHLGYQIQACLEFIC